MHNLDRTLDINEAEYEFEFEAEAEQEGEYETLGEMEQLELAAELLEVSNEQELENFFGDVFRKVGKGVSDFAKSSTGQALGGILKQAASKALPVIGGWPAVFWAARWGPASDRGPPTRRTRPWAWSWRASATTTNNSRSRSNSSSPLPSLPRSTRVKCQDSKPSFLLWKRATP